MRDFLPKFDHKVIGPHQIIKDDPLFPGRGIVLDMHHSPGRATADLFYPDPFLLPFFIAIDQPLLGSPFLEPSKEADDLQGDDIVLGWRRRDHYRGY